MKEGPGQNQSIVTKELYDTLAKEVAELKRTIHGKVELPLSRFTNSPLSSVDTIVVCKASEPIEQYMVTVVRHETTQGIVPRADLYDRSDVAVNLYTLGIAMEYANTGDPIRVQVSGTQYARIVAHDGDTYGSASDRMFRTGIELKPQTGGYVDVLDHSDIESPSFICLESNAPTDDIILVRILDQRDEYRGPFKGSISLAGTGITVGVDRAVIASSNAYDYDFNDRITWHITDNTMLTLLKPTAETVVVSADDTYVYYKVIKTSGALTAVLTASTTHPATLSTWLLTEWYVMLGKARFANNVVTAWIQYHQGQINIQDRTQTSFWAELTNRTSPYSWTRLQDDASTNFSPSVTGSSNALEVHGLDGIPEGTRVRLWPASDGTATYRFECGFGGLGSRDSDLLGASGETADTELWDRALQEGGKFGVLVDVITRMEWDPDSDAILYTFTRRHEYDSNGNLMYIAAEVRSSIISINEICDECGPTSTSAPTMPASMASASAGSASGGGSAGTGGGSGGGGNLIVSGAGTTDANGTYIKQGPDNWELVNGGFTWKIGFASFGGQNAYYIERLGGGGTYYRNPLNSTFPTDAPWGVHGFNGTLPIPTVVDA